MTREAIFPGQLFRLMLDEFRRRRPAACMACRMPLPYLVERPDDVSANWRIGAPTPCEHGCHRIIIDIAAELWPRYDLKDGFRNTGGLDAAASNFR